MGVADIIPGVSGGTIAFITGIYPELIASINNIDMQAFGYLKSLKLKMLWEHVNGTFLLTILTGITLSIFSMASLVTYLIFTHPVQLWSFFFGLIIISALAVIKEIKVWNIVQVIAMIIAAVFAYFLTTLHPINLPDNYFFVFLSGAIAICAMILPGISGSFLLLILGKYQYMLDAVKSLNIPLIAVFVIGCTVGILAFTRLIHWMLSRFHNITIASLVGFMIGALGKIWPWKVPTSFRLNSKGEQIPLMEENVLPNEFFAATGQNPYLWQAVLFFALGIGVVVLIEKVKKLLTEK